MPILRSATHVAPVPRTLLAAAALTVMLAACHEVAAPADGEGTKPAGVTPEGIVVAARISDTYFGPGDTVRATVVLRNPADTAVTLKAALLRFENAADSEPGVCARWVSPRRRFLTADGFCSGYDADVAADLIVPARDSLTYEFTLVGDAAMDEGSYTFWGEIGLRRASSDSLLYVASNPVMARLSH